jgi:hypothetical protein
MAQYGVGKQAIPKAIAGLALRLNGKLLTRNVAYATTTVTSVSRKSIYYFAGNFEQWRGLRLFFVNLRGLKPLRLPGR